MTLLLLGVTVCLADGDCPIEELAKISRNSHIAKRALDGPLG